MKTFSYGGRTLTELTGPEADDETLADELADQIEALAGTFHGLAMAVDGPAGAVWNFTFWRGRLHSYGCILGHEPHSGRQVFKRPFPAPTVH